MWELVRRSRGDVGIARCMEQGKTGELIKTKDPKSFRIWDLLARREGFEPPAFWSVGCLKHKSKPFRLRFVLFYRRSLGGFSIVSIQTCLLRFRSGSKVGQRRFCNYKSGFLERFLELSLFYGLSSPLNSEMICIFPYFCPYAESAREIREFFI